MPPWRAARTPRGLRVHWRPRRGGATAPRSGFRSAGAYRTRSALRPRGSPGPALRRGRGLALPVAVLLLEALDAPGRVHQLLLAGEEGMALRADFHPDVRSGGAGVNDLAAGARNGRLDILGMNTGLHGKSSPQKRK